MLHVWIIDELAYIHFVLHCFIKRFVNIIRSIAICIILVQPVYIAGALPLVELEEGAAIEEGLDKVKYK